MGFPRICTVTTRPKRADETSADYEFVSAETFNELTDIICVRNYLTYIEGAPMVHRYGLHKQSVQDGGLLISDFGGYKELLGMSQDNLVGIFMNTSYETCLQRAKNRTDFNEKEFIRRFEVDRESLNTEFLSDYAKLFPIYFINGDLSLSDVVDQFKEVLREVSI